MQNFNKDKQNRNTSWQKVSKWYDKTVGEKGSYFHQHVIIPNSLKLLNLKSSDSVLDLGCGQGIFARQIPKACTYVGVDLSVDLIKKAKNYNHNPKFSFIVSDITKPIDLSSLPIGNKKDFSAGIIILALQNVEAQDMVIKNASMHLKSDSKLLIVLNHPAFRIPRQTGWGIDEQNKLQYRKIFRYLSPLKVPINMNPGSQNPGQKTLTWSFHQPISYYAKSLKENGFLIEAIEEWVSDKKSEGKAAKMENRSREEIPLFLAILASKL